MIDELFDFSKDFVNITRVFAEDTALEHQRVGLGGCVTHLAKAGDALVCVDPQYCATLGSTVDIDKTHIGDSKI